MKRLGDWLCDLRRWKDKNDSNYTSRFFMLIEGTELDVSLRERMKSERRGPRKTL